MFIQVTQFLCNDSNKQKMVSNIIYKYNTKYKPLFKCTGIRCPSQKPLSETFITSPWEVIIYVFARVGM